MSHIILRTQLTPEIVPKLIDELVPEGQRGKKVRSYGLIEAQGMTGQFFYNYELSTGQKALKFLIINSLQRCLKLQIRRLWRSSIRRECVSASPTRCLALGGKC